MPEIATGFAIPSSGLDDENSVKPWAAVQTAPSTAHHTASRHLGESGWPSGNSSSSSDMTITNTPSNTCEENQ